MFILNQNGSFELVDNVFDVVKIIIEQYKPTKNSLPKIIISDHDKEFVITFNSNLIGWTVADTESTNDGKGNIYSPSVLDNPGLLILVTYIARASLNDEKFNPEEPVYQNIDMMQFIETKMLIRGFVNSIFESENTK